MGCLHNLIHQLPDIDGYCCGCSLSSGTKTIGWLQLVLNVLLVIFGSFVVGLMPCEFWGGNLAGAMITGFFGVAFHLLGSFLGAILLMGVYQNDLKKIKLWLKVSIIIFMVTAALASLGLLIIFATISPLFVILIVPAWIVFGLDFFFLVVVKSFYVKHSCQALRQAAAQLEASP